MKKGRSNIMGGEYLNTDGMAEEFNIPKPKPSSSFFVDPMKNFMIGRNKPEQQLLNFEKDN